MNSPRRVALLLTSPGWRGSGTSFVKIALGLSDRGHQVRCVAGDTEVAERLAAAGVTVDLVPTGDTGRREVTAVRALFRHHGADVVLCDSPRDVRIARYASWPRRRPIVWRYNLHGRRLATDVLQRWLFGGLRQIVHQSRYGAARLAADSPWLARRPSAIIPNGFDVDVLRPDPARGVEVRRTHGIPEKATLVVTPTGTHTEKAIEVARRAVERLSAGREVYWAVTTKAGESGTGSLHVRGVGWLTPAALGALLEAADLVLLPSPGELFNNVAAEAMAVGAVVVGADSGATPEVIGDAGALFRAGDPSHAAVVMEQLLADPARCAVLGEQARSRIANAFPLAAMQAGFDTLVRSID